MGGLVEIKPYRGFYVRSFSRSETADLYELFKRLECFAVELAVPQMSDHDICRARSRILRESRRAIRKFRAHRGASAGCAANPAPWHNSELGPEFAERAAHNCDDIIQAFKARDTPRAAFLVRGRINHTQEAILASFPDEAASR
jgi:DNA-binding GntR family transcriptional regulator